MLDLAVAGSATVLPAVLDFDRDREASPARMNRAMEYLFLRLAAATALQPEFESAIGELQAVGLDRLNEVLGPIFAESTAIAAQLGAIRTAWLTGAPFDQLLNDLTAQVTARLATVDAAVAAQLSGVAGQLAAQNTAVSDKLASLSPTAKWAEASTAEARAGTASRLISAAVLWAMQAPAALVDAPTIALDLGSGGENYAVTIGANRVLGNPTGGRAGQTGSIFVTQDGIGGRVLSYAANYVPDDLTTFPLLNAAPGAVTELRYKVAADGKVRLYGGKPAGGKLIVTLTAMGYSQIHYATKAQNVSYRVETLIGANANGGRLYKGVPGNRYQTDLGAATAANPLVGSTSLAATESLLLSAGSDGSFCSIVEN